MAGTAVKKTRALKPGDHVRARVGRREVEWTVTGASGGRVHVSFKMKDADEPVSRLYRESQVRSD
ncbi:hypothetical protein GCM10023318_55260 [Nocardia callitridis]|uniref:Uncharacterized protein n=1 Tax=Nocardia callitridis TaxID=648753 RepID=A0ABP9KVP0_9NOCA